jgi:hypothetical protein
VAISIASLLSRLAGPARGKRRSRDVFGRGTRARTRRSAPVCIAEPLEARALLAVDIFLSNGILVIDQVTPNFNDVEVAFSTGTVFDPNDLTKSALVQGVTVTATNATLPVVPPLIPSAKFLPFRDPFTAAQINGVTILQNDPTSTIRVTDEISGVKTVEGGASWRVTYTTADLGQQSLQILNQPSFLTVTSPATVKVGGNFTASAGVGDVTIQTTGIVVGAASVGGPLTGRNVTLDTATNGNGPITFSGNLTATDRLTVLTNASMNISTTVKANQTDLTLNAGGTQTGGSLGTVGISPTFTLVTGDDVSFGLTANLLGEISSISAIGKSVTLGTAGPVTQSGAVVAASLRIESLGSVTLANENNNVDSLGISAVGSVTFTDQDALSLGVAGLGIVAAPGNPVTLTTRGNLTQAAGGRVVADTFSVNILDQGTGNADLNLNSPNNQIVNFTAVNNSAGGAIAIVNTPIGSPLTIAPAGVTALNGPVSIDNRTGIVINGKIDAGASGTLTLSSVGGITQSAAAQLKALSLAVTNKGSTGGIDLAAAANDIADVSLVNNSTGVASSIVFKGSNAASGRLTIVGDGVTAALGDIEIDTSGRKLRIDAGITTVGGDVELTSAGGVIQASSAAIFADGLKVTNTGGGSVTLTAPANDVGTLEIRNSGATAAVSYADVNDLTLAPGAGITANGKVVLSIGDSFTANAGSPITTTVGEVAITTLNGLVTLEGGVTAAAGVSVSAGTKTAAGIVVNSGIDAGTGGVSLVATDTLSSNAAGTVLGKAGVSISATTGVSLGAAVNSTSAGVTVGSTKGPLTTTAAGKLIADGGAVTVNTLGAATFGGTVTATGAINVTAGDADTSSNVVVDAAFNAGGGVQVSASNALVTKAAVSGAEVTATSGGNTTLGGPVTGTTGAVTFQSGGSLSSNASSNINATGTVAATSVRGMSLSGGALGTQVTLVAGTADSAASVAIKAAVVATAGDATITATGGNLTTSASGTVKATGGDATLLGTTGVLIQTKVAADNVTIASADGAVSLGDKSQVTATGGGGVTLTAANGISQSATSLNIVAGSVVATNTTAGEINLVNPTNAVANFQASNAAAGGQVKFVNKVGLTVTTPGIVTTNGLVDIVNGGFITLAGGINAGTADVSLQAAGNITQSVSAAILADDLFLGNTGGDILLDTASSNNVNFLWGNNSFLGGKFFYVDADALEIAAPITRPITTNNGDVAITSGRLGLGPLTVGGTVNAGTADISLTATGGITGLAVHALQTTKGVVTLNNNGSGDIVLLNPGNSYPSLSALSPNGTTINLKNSSVVGTNIVGDGLVTLGGVIKINSIGSITQSSIVETKDATFLSKANIILPLINNDIDNLAAEAPGNITFFDRDDLAIGVGGQGVISTSGVASISLAALGGDLTLNAKVSTSNTTEDATKTTLFAGNSIIQTTANVISSDLSMTAAGGRISLPQGKNDIANLRAFAAADIEYVDFNDFEVGFDSVVPVFPKPLGVVAGGSLRLVAGPTLSPIVPRGLLRVTEGLAWQGNLTLSAGLNSRVGFVEFAVTNPGDSLPFAGVLRNMIEYANRNTATQTIRGATRVQPMRVVFDEFLDSPLYTVLDVQPSAPLPAITNPLDFNGTLSATGRVGVDGSSILIAATVNGLVYNPGSDDSRFEGMAVHGFATGSGLQLRSAANFVENNFFGVRRDGLTLSSNKIGIEMLGQTSTTNLIGSLIVNERAANVIGGNTVAGVLIRNGASGNSIMGNFIGTDAGLLNDLGNLGDGIIINAANGNVVGNRNAVRPDGSAAASNAIAYNNGTGIRVTNARAANENLGNLIENNLVDANGVDGIGILRSRFQVVGGGTLQQANVVTSQVTGNGINVTGSFDTRITGNFIGVDDVGTVGLGNAAAGVLVSASQRTVINQGNAIGGNQTGVFVNAGSTLTRIEANFVGTDAFGSPVGNALDGVRIDRSLENFVQLGNVVANNGRHGVSITDATAATINRGNIVAANTISANGFAAFGAGVNVEGGARHTIGGSGGGNVIMANANEGIRVVRSSRTGGTTGLRIQGNKVGTDANEEIDPALGNTVGIRLVESVDSLVDQTNVIANNSGEGIRLEATTRATIGSVTVDQANAVTANGGAGILVTDKISTAGNARGRNIGTSVFGNLVTENLGPGVVVEGGMFPSGAPRTSGVVVGTQTGSTQAGAGRGNTIVDNGVPDVGACGIVIDGAQGVSFSGNTIYRTDGLLDPPPAVEFRNGANAGAVAPRLESAVVLQPSLASSQVRVTGTFAQTPLGQTAGNPVSVTVQNGVATFSASQTGLVEAGSVVVINGTGYRVASVAADGRSASLQGITTLLATGAGRVSASSGAATFSVSQTGVLAVGSSIVVAGRSYQLTSLSANGLSGTLSGAPTFSPSSFQLPGTAGFSVVPASVLGQQYIVSVYLNEYWDGNPATSKGYGMRLFVGTISVTVGATGPGTFSGTISPPAGVSALGQFVTVTATPARPIDGTTVPATSAVSAPVQVGLNTP